MAIVYSLSYMTITTAWSTGRVPQDWMDALMVLLFLRRGNALIATTTRASPFSVCQEKSWHELLNIVLPDMLRERLTELQCGFKPGWSCTDAMFFACLLLSRWSEYQQYVHLCFIHLVRLGVILHAFRVP